MELKDKDYIKFKTAVVLQKKLDENIKSVDQQKVQGNKGTNIVSSYRKLEAATGVPIASISEILSGKRNAALTTLVTLVYSLGFSMESFGKAFDSVTDQEVNEFWKGKSKNKT